MNDLFIAFSNSLTALALCMAVGFICRKTGMLNDEHTTGLTNLLVRVAMPCTVFMALMRPFSRTLLFESLATFVISGVIYILSGFAGLLVAKAMKSPAGERQGLHFGIAFGNVAFMGIPVVTAVFGYEGLIYVSMAMASFNIIAFTYGVRMFDNAPREISVIGLIKRNPALPATLIGFIFFVTEFRLPLALEGGVSLIGGLTTPVSMILLGVILAKQSLKNAFKAARLFFPVAVKLIAIPVVTWLVLRPIIHNTLMLNVIVTLMAMPPGVLTAIFAEQYDADSFAAAKFVVLGTILCVVTVPVLSLLLS